MEIGRKLRETTTGVSYRVGGSIAKYTVTNHKSTTRMCANLKQGRTDKPVAVIVAVRIFAFLKR